jgi:hypothetical protein
MKSVFWSRVYKWSINPFTNPNRDNMLFLWGQFSLFCVINSKYFLPSLSECWQRWRTRNRYFASADSDGQHDRYISAQFLEVVTSTNLPLTVRQAYPVEHLVTFGWVGKCWEQNEPETRPKNETDAPSYACLRYWKSLRRTETGEAVGNYKVISENEAASRGSWGHGSLYHGRGWDTGDLK